MYRKKTVSWAAVSILCTVINFQSHHHRKYHSKIWSDSRTGWGVRQRLHVQMTDRQEREKHKQKPQLWEERGQSKHSNKDKEDSYPGLPKLHLTCRRCWTAPEDTKPWWKRSKQPVLANLSHVLRDPQVFIFPFQPFLSKFPGWTRTSN